MIKVEHLRLNIYLLTRLQLLTRREDAVSTYQFFMGMQIWLEAIPKSILLWLIWYH